MSQLLSKLKGYWKALEGKKSYLIATAGTILNIVVILYPTLLAPSTILKLDGILVALGGVAIRSAVSR